MVFTYLNVSNLMLSSENMYGTRPFLSISNHSDLNNSVSYQYSFCLHTVKWQKSSMQKIQLSGSTVSMSKTVLIQQIQFSISMQFSSIWLIDKTLSGATTPSKSETGSDGNEGVLCIPQSSNITGVTWRTVKYLIIFTNPSARAGYDTRSIFKLSLTGLNSEFSLLLD